MRRWELVLSIARLGFVAAGVIAITYQAATLKFAHVFAPGNFFSFFTIQANTLALLVLAAAVVVRRSERSAGFDAVRGGVTLYMAITGVVFAVLLSELQEKLDTHVPWVNFIVHTLLPIVMVADWLIDPPLHHLGLWVAAVWLVYPLAWFVYTLVRGSHVGWYPYPFVDVSEHGYGRVFLNGVGLLAGFAAAAAVVLLVGNWRGATMDVRGGS